MQVQVYFLLYIMESTLEEQRKPKHFETLEQKINIEFIGVKMNQRFTAHLSIEEKKVLYFRSLF